MQIECINGEIFIAAYGVCVKVDNPLYIKRIFAERQCNNINGCKTCADSFKKLPDAFSADNIKQKQRPEHYCLRFCDKRHPIAYCGENCFVFCRKAQGKKNKKDDDLLDKVKDTVGNVVDFLDGLF